MIIQVSSRSDIDYFYEIHQDFYNVKYLSLNQKLNTSHEIEMFYILGWGIHSGEVKAQSV